MNIRPLLQADIMTIAVCSCTLVTALFFLSGMMITKISGVFLMLWGMMSLHSVLLLLEAWKNRHYSASENLSLPRRLLKMIRTQDDFARAFLSSIDFRFFLIVFSILAYVLLQIFWPVRTDISDMKVKSMIAGFFALHGVQDWSFDPYRLRSLQGMAPGLITALAAWLIYQVALVREDFFKIILAVLAPFFLLALVLCFMQTIVPVPPSSFPVLVLFIAYGVPCVDFAKAQKSRSKTKKFISTAALIVFIAMVLPLNLGRDVPVQPALWFIGTCMLAALYGALRAAPSRQYRIFQP